MNDKLTILVVDDEEVERNGIIKVLNKAKLNIEVLAFENSKLAANYLQNNSCDILITDIKMPIISGLELLEIAKKLHPHIKALLISAFAEFDFAREAVRLGAVNYLLKPIDTEWLVKFIEIETSSVSKGEVIGKYTSLTKQLLGNTEKEYSKSVHDTITIIENNYHLPSLNLMTITNKIFISTGYLCNIFKKETGMSVARFLNCYRLERAKDLLVNSNLKINNIMHRVGFENFPHFCYNFKMYFGVNPSKFRGEEDD